MSNPVCQACGHESGNERRALDKIAELQARHKRDLATIRTLRERVRRLQKLWDAL